MDKDITLADIISNVLNTDKTLEEQVADLGALIVERDREKSKFKMNNQKLENLEKMISMQEKVIINLFRNDESSIPSKANVPHLKVIK